MDTETLFSTKPYIYDCSPYKYIFALIWIFSVKNSALIGTENYSVNTEDTGVNFKHETGVRNCWAIVLTYCGNGDNALGL